MNPQSPFLFAAPQDHADRGGGGGAVASAPVGEGSNILTFGAALERASALRPLHPSDRIRMIALRMVAQGQSPYPAAAAAGSCGGCSGMTQWDSAVASAYRLASVECKNKEAAMQAFVALIQGLVKRGF